MWPLTRCAARCAWALALVGLVAYSAPWGVYVAWTAGLWITERKA